MSYRKCFLCGRNGHGIHALIAWALTLKGSENDEKIQRFNGYEVWKANSNNARK